MPKLEITAEPGKQEIVMTRVFDAPRELLFRTWMDPQAVPNFWGPAYLTTKVDQMDVRPGGSWRFVQRDPDGNEYGFHGVYHEITPGRRVVQTFEYEGVAGHVALETMTLEDLPDGKTKATMQSVFQSVEDRDGMLQSGMEGGANEIMDRLEDLVKAKV